MAKQVNKTKTASKTFDANAFFNETFYAPIAHGKHTVTLGKIKVVTETKEDGEPSTYMIVPLKFENGRVVEARWYNYGIQIACGQLRRQLQDNTDYPSVMIFLDSLENKTLDVWVDSRSYIANDGTSKTTLQYDFTEPAAKVTAVEDEI